ncbi:MAG: hypothetical protein AUG80_07035 [Candidatus Rokubacteria bacterium 13_1_20CM_4_68_9]|nr:MAG: hypothetical protein AUG80_07035 [Candidatus Rokubacteria bacterium 13_1_20CM_4_68_9]
MEGLVVVGGGDRVSPLAGFLEQGQVVFQLGDLFLGAVEGGQLRAPLFDEPPNLIDYGERLQERRLSDRRG